MTSLRIGYSPCPNDTFIMAALAQGRVETSLRFRIETADVEKLNEWALAARLEVTKLSFAALGRVRDRYALLHSGAALGRGCGPLVVSRAGTHLDALHEGIVASPGELTTAALLLALFHGEPLRFRHMLFSEIMPAVARGDADFGLVIHEGRFTFAEHGLDALVDLGAWWEEETGSPIPLGGIAVRRDIGQRIAREVDLAIARSLMMADPNSDETMRYVRSHAQEMDLEVIRQHIGLYVNSFTRDIGPEGEAAVAELFARGQRTGLIPRVNLPLLAY
ncbi:MAG: 1,4-dihydroxy-6-naphthoate synthase [Thermodesulfobacteriota bacterium]